jgi:Type I phosphodiesterase / nucleotide pyrophosphatase
LWLAGALACLCAMVPVSEAVAKEPLVYVVVIDGLDGDAVEAGNAPFISGLMNGTGGKGSYFPGSRSVIPAETNPNHTAMMTGALPGKSGIAANAFAMYAPLLNEDTCETTGPFDYSMMPTATSGESPTCPRAETIFEAVRRQAGAKHPLTSVVMGKPKLGRIFDVTYKGRRAADALWAPCDDTPEDDEYCADVDTNPITGYAASDGVVMDEVIAQIENGITVGGKQKRAKFTFVNLPMVDSVGHVLGRGPFYDQFVGTADAEIERLADALKAAGEWNRSAIIITSDHSMDTTPTKVSLTSAIEGAGVPADAFTVVQNGSVDFIYLADRKAPQGERDDLLATMREAILGASGVNEALYRKRNRANGDRANTIRKVHPDWSSGIRTGDIVATSDVGVAFSEPDLSGNPLNGNHGAPQTEDNFMSVVGGWPRIKTGTVDGNSNRALIRNNDIASTVMRLFGLQAPKASVGSPIKAAFKKGTLRKRR